MNYKEARAYIEETTKFGSILGLNTIRKLLEILHNPQDKLKFVHVAGTNGKGSTVAFISEILKSADYKVGRYVSPSVFTYREKIQINGKNIEKEEFAKIVALVKKAVTKMVIDGFSHPTSFEIETAVAFYYFYMKKCDIVVLETGMGGRLDATNIIKNTVCSVFTSISMDHMGFLGNTIEEIAENKAGIIKKGASIITTNQTKKVVSVLMEEAKQYDEEIILADGRKAYNIKATYEKQLYSYKQYTDLTISLSGSYQISNSILAIETVTALSKAGFSVTEQHLREGLKKTKWDGRFTLVSKEPLFFVDGAHNIDAAKQLKQSIKAYFPEKKIIFIMGVFKDKTYEKMVQIMLPVAKEFITITPKGERGFSAEELKQVIYKYEVVATAVGSIKEAVELSKEKAKKEGVIVAFGSLSYLCEIKQCLENTNSL